MERRDMLKALAAIPLGAWALTETDIVHAAERTDTLLLQAATQQPAAFVPKFFTTLEWRTVNVLADIVIPRDSHSGSATEAGVPQFMDFVMMEYTNNQARMRDGLGWLNGESRSRFGAPFPDITAAQRIQIVDDIAWPAKAPQGHPGVRFFNAFRDLTASGFYTSRIGVKDIGYMGNQALAAWTGCPPVANRHAGA